MKVTLWVDWMNQEVYSEKEFEELARERAEEIADIECYPDEFSDWLFDNFSALEIWDASQERKDELYNQYCEECYQGEKSNLYEECEKIFIDIGEE